MVVSTEQAPTLPDAPSVRVLRASRRIAAGCAARSPRNSPRTPTISATTPRTCSSFTAAISRKTATPARTGQGEGVGKHLHVHGPLQDPRRQAHRRAIPRHRRPGRQVRQRHAAHHHPAGHSSFTASSSRTCKPPSPASTTACSARSARCGDVEPQRHGLPRPVRRRRSPCELQDTADAIAAAPGAAHRAYHEIWLNGESCRRRRPDEARSRSTARSICRASSRSACRCPKTIASTSTPRISASWPSSRTASIVGYNVLVGGGMGMTHGNANTFPHLAQPICFVQPIEVVPHGGSGHQALPRSRQPGRPQAGPHQIRRPRLGRRQVPRGAGRIPRHCRSRCRADVR